jgi:hypothetical protein
MEITTECCNRTYEGEDEQELVGQDGIYYEPFVPGWFHQPQSLCPPDPN